MAEIVMFIHDGFEEVEALTAVDVLRRAGVGVTICSMTGSMVLKGSHGIKVLADADYDDFEGPADVCGSFDGMVLPGGLPNAFTLRDDERIIRLVGLFDSEGKIVAAICAAPCVLERAGILEGRKCTSYPDSLSSQNKTYVEDSVVTDGNIITSRGVGTALDFALEIVSKLCGEEKAKNVAAQILHAK